MIDVILFFAPYIFAALAILFFVIGYRKIKNGYESDRYVNGGLLVVVGLCFAAIAIYIKIVV